MTPPCRHRRCTLAARAGWPLGAAAFASMIWAIAAPSVASIAAFAAAAGATFASVLVTCPPGDLMAVADATRELPRRWTAADWAELERELTKGPGQ
jgi:hypothetical protein